MGESLVFRDGGVVDTPSPWLNANGLNDNSRTATSVVPRNFIWNPH